MKRRHAASWAGRIGQVARTGYKVYKKYRSLTGTTQKRQSDNYITGHHDSRGVYRYKRMPRKKKKAWKKFSSKVNAVVSKSLGQRHVVLNDSTTATAVANTQYFAAIELYGVEGTASFGTDDMDRINAADSLITTQCKTMFRSGVLDITFANTGGVTIELDLYKFEYRRTANFDNIVGLTTSLMANSPDIGATGLSMTTVGTTPWQCPSLGRYVKILKKTKFFVPVGGQTTYQHRDPRNHVWNSVESDVRNGVGIRRANFTQGVMIVAKGIPTAAAGAGAISLSFGATRTYNYCINAYQQAADGLV